MALKPLIFPDQQYQCYAMAMSKSLTAVANLTETDLWHVDLRGLDADGLDFSHCYFRGADLRGVDLSHAKLHGASFNSAKISGLLFPLELAPEEIKLSVDYGTRVRYRK